MASQVTTRMLTKFEREALERKIKSAKSALESAFHRLADAKDHAAPKKELEERQQAVDDATAALDDLCKQGQDAGISVEAMHQFSRGNAPTDEQIAGESLALLTNLRDLGVSRAGQDWGQKHTNQWNSIHAQLEKVSDMHKQRAEAGGTPTNFEMQPSGSAAPVTFSRGNQPTGDSMDSETTDRLHARDVQREQQQPIQMSRGGGGGGDTSALQSKLDSALQRRQEISDQYDKAATAPDAGSLAGIRERLITANIRVAELQHEVSTAQNHNPQPAGPQQYQQLSRDQEQAIVEQGKQYAQGIVAEQLQRQEAINRGNEAMKPKGGGGMVMTAAGLMFTL